jgi:hypothetical protein
VGERGQVRGGASWILGVTDFRFPEASTLVTLVVLGGVTANTGAGGCFHLHLGLPWAAWINQSLIYPVTG